MLRGSLQTSSGADLFGGADSKLKGLGPRSSPSLLVTIPPGA
jgi:hypothetical protein